MNKFNVIQVAGVVLIFIAFILLVVGTATAGWAKVEFVSYIYGVSYGSYSASISAGLADAQSVPAGQATEAFAVLSILASVGALFFMGTYLVLEQLEKLNDKLAKLPLIAHIITAVGAVCALIAIIIFAAKFYGELKYKPDYSWVLVIIGGVFLEVGGFLCHKANKLSKIGGSG